MRILKNLYTDQTCFLLFEILQQLYNIENYGTYCTVNIAISYIRPIYNRIHFLFYHFYLIFLNRDFSLYLTIFFILFLLNPEKISRIQISFS